MSHQVIEEFKLLNDEGISVQEMDVIGQKSLSLVSQVTSYCPQSFRGFFPRFKKAGKVEVLVEDKVNGDVSAAYRTCCATTFKHDRVLFALIMGMTREFTKKTVLLRRLENKNMPLNRIKGFMKYNFSMGELSSAVTDKNNPRTRADIWSHLCDLANVTVSYSIAGQDQGICLQWLAAPEYEGEVGSIYVNELFLKKMLDNPMRIEYEKIMSIRDEKAGRAALLIEESKYNGYFSDYINHAAVMEYVSPRTQRGQKVTIGEIQTAFIVAYEAGYPLYVAGLTKENKLTWCQSESPKEQVQNTIKLFRQCHENGTLKKRLKEG